jgi:hypothetical protein
MGNALINILKPIRCWRNLPRNLNYKEMKRMKKETRGTGFFFD